MTGAYYNEIEPHTAQWLRNLIKAGHIAPGDVDERSIEDVRPDDLRGYTQCHFFAGIGVWSYALRLAGWPDDRPVWSGSCPCQPFSAAGKGAGFADERHLWPAWAWLIGERRPAVILGEQVASKDIDPWIDLVQADLEAMGYAVGCVPFPSAGVGAPHIRDRAYFMADANHTRPQGRQRVRERAAERTARSRGVVVELADAIGERIQVRGSGEAASAAPAVRGEARQQRVRPDAWTGGAAARELADATDVGLDGRWPSKASDGRDAPRIEFERLRDAGDRPGPTNGFWRAADWLLCRDEKWRPVEPGSFPLVDGAPARVVRLRAYGNAINAKAAAEFIRAARDSMTTHKD